MVVRYNKVKARLFIGIGLAFLLTFLSISCFQDRRQDVSEIKVRWQNQQAIALEIPLIDGKTSDIEKLKVSLQSSASKTGVLGSYTIEGTTIIFYPLIPLTPNLTYGIYKDSILLKTITIPIASNAEAPVITAVFPSKDTIPENLLKMYFRFSKPMQETRSLNYIQVYDAKNDSLVDVFLDLQPELWNKERTQLTLWIDPGRVKTALIPNKERGLPIIQNNDYKIVISRRWKDYSGIPIGKEYYKSMVVGSRDSNSPKINSWEIKLPIAGSENSLRIDFKEPMDAVLATETLTIYTVDNVKIEGTFSLINKEQSILFMPELPWQKGSYYVLVDATLEDLAGNNLTRLFDTDLHSKIELNQEPFQKKMFTISD